MTIIARLLATMLLAACALAMLPAPTLAQAQTAPSMVTRDPHVAMFEAIYQGVDQEQVLEAMLQQVATQVVTSQPEAAQMEAQSPGLMLELMLALRPVLRDYRDRVRREFDPQIIAAMREVFSDAEAASLARLYNSDLGRRMMGSYAGNVSMNQTIDQALDQQDITAEAVARDDAVTVSRSVGSMMANASAAELREMAELPQRYPALLRMPELQQATLPIRTAMENAPPSAAEELAIQQGIVDAFEKYLEREHN